MRVGVLLVTAMMMGACASIASLDHIDGETAEPSTQSSSGDSRRDDGATSGQTSSGTSSGAGSSGMSTSSSSSGAPVEAGADVVAPAPDNGPCAPDGTCTNGQKCSEDRKCRDRCSGVGTPCVFSTSQCCLGSYCPFGVPLFDTKCKKCIEKGKKADKELPSSCCSGEVDDGECQ